MNKKLIILKKDIAILHTSYGSSRYEYRLPDGTLVKRYYSGYTKREALNLFKKYCQEEYNK